MPPSQASVAAAVASTSRQVGMTLGVAVLGTVAGRGRRLVARRARDRHPPAWWLIVALGAGIVVLGLVSSTPAAKAGAERTALRLGEAMSDDAAQRVWRAMSDLVLAEHRRAAVSERSG